MKTPGKSIKKNEKALTPVNIHINTAWCKGCGYCVEFCPKQVLSISSETGPKGYNPAVVNDQSKCVACGSCMAVCPEFAITITDNTVHNIKDGNKVHTGKKRR